MDLYVRRGIGSTRNVYDLSLINDDFYGNRSFFLIMWRDISALPGSLLNELPLMVEFNRLRSIDLEMFYNYSNLGRLSYGT